MNFKNIKEIKSHYNYSIINWDEVVLNSLPTIELYKEIQNFVDWGLVSKNIDFSIEFADFFIRDIDWYYTSQKPLTAEFIKHFHNKLFWSQIFKYQKLTEHFIREFEHKPHLEQCIFTNDFSEDFLIELKGRFLTKDIVRTQNFSMKLILDYGLDPESVLPLAKNMSLENRKKIEKYIKMSNIYQ
jgi:hypothetical protein